MKKTVILTMAIAMMMTAASCKTGDNGESAKTEAAAEEKFTTAAAAENDGEDTADTAQTTEESGETAEDNETDPDDEFLEDMPGMAGEDEEIDLSKAFEQMAGEYVCEYADTGISCKNMERKTVKDMFEGTKITVSEDGVLEMGGTEYQLEAHEPFSMYETYLLLIEGNGCEYENNDFGNVYAYEDFEGPSNVRFTVKGQDIGFNGTKAKDCIEIYYSPAGTDQWYYDLGFCRVGEENIGL